MLQANLSNVMAAEPKVDCSDESVVELTCLDGIATLTMARPKQFNALSRQMLEALTATLQVLAQDKTIRVVVIAAQGKAFALVTICARCCPWKVRTSIEAFSQLAPA